jgi:hypothetical protein
MLQVPQRLGGLSPSNRDRNLSRCFAVIALRPTLSSTAGLESSTESAGGVYVKDCLQFLQHQDQAWSPYCPGLCPGLCSGSCLRRMASVVLHTGHSRGSAFAAPVGSSARDLHLVGVLLGGGCSGGSGGGCHHLM